MSAIDKLAAGISAVARPSVNTTVADWADLMREPLLTSGIGNSGKRIAAFLGQVGVESAGFTAIEENLNYSAAALMKTWPARFPANPDLIAQRCNRNPEMIANVVYCNRMGNGDEDSGDGWRYRGAGLIQLTGRDNQLACAKALFVDPAKIGDYLRTPVGAINSAVWFWTTNGLLPMSDAWFLSSISRKVNGGTNGMQERIDACNKVLAVVGA